MNYENGARETVTFEDYNAMISYLVDHSDAGFVAFDDGEQMNEVDISRDVELCA